jgi:hypothetical protein
VLGEESDDNSIGIVDRYNVEEEVRRWERDSHVDESD